MKRDYWMEKCPPKEREDGRRQDTLFLVINTSIVTSPSTRKLLWTNHKAYVFLVNRSVREDPG